MIFPNGIRYKNYLHFIHITKTGKKKRRIAIPSSLKYYGTNEHMVRSEYVISAFRPKFLPRSTKKFFVLQQSS